MFDHALSGIRLEIVHHAFGIDVGADHDMDVVGAYVESVDRPPAKFGNFSNG